VNADIDRFTRSSVRAPVPTGWFEKQSVTLLSPDGQANVIASREPLDPTIDTGRYAAVQGDLLRKEFPGYREHAFTVVALGAGPAYMRHFSWTPPDGVAVVQQQIYFTRPGTGYTATATTPHASAERFAALFDEVLRRLEFDTAPEPATAPAPFAAAPVPACTVTLSLPPDGMPPPLAREVPGAVDRLVVAATDALAGTPGLFGLGGASRPVDAWDLAALRQECDRLLALDGAVERVLSWGDAAAAEGGPASAAWTEARATGSTPPPDLVWATSALLVDLADAGSRGGTPEAGLAGVLDRVTRQLPEPDAGWSGYASAVRRHPRYHLLATLEKRSGHLLWSGDGEARARWNGPVSHFALPIPLPLARRIADLLRWFDALGEGLAVPSFQSPWNAFLSEYRALVPEIRAALGPAYVVEDRIAPDRTG
jgi:hypothetical protein